LGTFSRAIPHSSFGNSSALLHGYIREKKVKNRNEVGFMGRSEEEEIRKTLETFLDGLRSLDYDKISETFYGEGLSIGVSRDQGQISHVLRDHWRKMGERERAKGEDFSQATVHWKIRSLSIIGNAASVIIDLAFGTRSAAGEKITERYIDFYHLLKTNEKWIIVNKIYPTNIDVKRKQKMDKWPITS
jgi:hypothetical protein